LCVFCWSETVAIDREDIGSFDSTVHVSEEASNAAVAVPWAIILSTFIAGMLGLGMSFIILAFVTVGRHLIQYLCNAAINVVLALCMGNDLGSLMGSSLGQPLAQIFFNSFGKKATLALWTFIIMAQYMMGSNMVCVSFVPQTDGL